MPLAATSRLPPIRLPSQQTQPLMRPLPKPVSPRTSTNRWLRPPCRFRLLFRIRTAPDLMPTTVRLGQMINPMRRAMANLRTWALPVRPADVRPRHRARLHARCHLYLPERQHRPPLPRRLRLRRLIRLHRLRIRRGADHHRRLRRHPLPRRRLRRHRHRPPALRHRRPLLPVRLGADHHPPRRQAAHRHRPAADRHHRLRPPRRRVEARPRGMRRRRTRSRRAPRGACARRPVSIR